MAKIRCEKRGSSWRYIFEGAKVDGSRKRFTKGGFATKAEAQKAGAKAYAEYNDRGISFTPSSISFSDFLNSWLDDYVAVSLKQGTYENYKKRIEYHIKPVLGKYKLSALSPPTLQKFINDKAKAEYSRNTLTVLKGILSGSLSYAVQQGLLATNPMNSVKLPSPRNERIKSRSQPHHYIPPETMEKILQRFPPGTTAYLPLMLGYHCGLRLGEAFGLTWDRVDLEAKTITIDKQVQWDEEQQLWYFTKPKYNSFRTIEIDDEMYGALKDAYEFQQKAREFYGNLFTDYKANNDRRIIEQSGGSLRLVNIRENGTWAQPRIMQHAAAIIHQQLGIKEFTFHSLRHTHATMLAENDAPPKYIMQRLGHSNIKVTMEVYQHTTEKIINKGDEVLKNMFNNKPNGL